MYSYGWTGGGSAGPPIVLIHGMGVSGRYFEPLARALAPERSVWIIDLPGFGRSSRPEEVLDVPTLAAEVGRWLAEVGISRGILVGHSMGAQVAVEAALRQPASVSGLVLMGPTFDPTARSAWRQMMRLALSAFRERPSAWALALRDYLRCGPRRLLRTLLAGLTHHLEERLPLVMVPALVVRGASDAVAPRRWAVEACQLLREARLIEVDGAGHAVQHKRPEEAARAVIAFAESLGR